MPPEMGSTGDRGDDGNQADDLMGNVPGLSQPPIEVQPIGNGAAPVVVPAIKPESLVAVVDAPVVKPEEKETEEK
jgi:hypothetical protein